MKLRSFYIAALLMCTANFCFGQDKEFLIISRNTAEFTMWDGVKMRGFGFNDGLGNPPLPAPTLNMNEGDSVIIDLWNISQGAPHTIHLHGLDVNQPNDGVPHLSFSVPHMEHGFYRFRAPHPGTYLYHCHVASTIHVQAGMYGMIIVRPKHGLNQTWDGGYWYTDELNWLASEIDTFWHKDSILEHPHDTALKINPVSIPDYRPQYFLINGKSESELASPLTAVRIHEGETLFLRIANVGFLANRIQFPEGFNAEIISSDGRPLPSVLEQDTLWVFPGERYGVMLKPEVRTVDSVRYAYVDMNTMKTVNTQFVPATTDFVSVKDIEEKSFQVRAYPVPSSSNQAIVIETSEPLNETSRIEILNGLGNTVYQKDIPQNEYGRRFSINPERLTAGIYWCRIISDHGGLKGQTILVLTD